MSRGLARHKLFSSTKSVQLSLFVPLLLFSSIAYPVDCNTPPTGFGGSWWRAYAAWCSACGGIPNSGNTSCSPGANWGGQGSGDSPQPSYDYEAERQRQLEDERLRLEAERQRQQEIENLRKIEEEKERHRREEFERNKQEALKSMKGISEGELGLKSTETGELGLKAIGESGPHGLDIKHTQTPASKPKTKKMECEWGTQGSSVVDLRCLGLDPDKPITVDPHIARGQERAFPAQPDPKTFENANYNKGFEALMRFDVTSAADAVTYFKQAQKERPKEPLVRNGLLLAQDIFKARQKKEKDDQAKATYLTLQCYAALMTGDNETAKGYIAQARKLAPNDSNAQFLESVAQIDLGAEGTYPARKNAYRLVANGLASLSKKNLNAGIDMLEAAQRLQPEDRFIDMLVGELHKYAGRK